MKARRSLATAAKPRHAVRPVADPLAVWNLLSDINQLFSTARHKLMCACVWCRWCTNDMGAADWPSRWAKAHALWKRAKTLDGFGKQDPKLAARGSDPWIESIHVIKTQIWGLDLPTEPWINEILSTPCHIGCVGRTKL